MKSILIKFIVFVAVIFVTLFIYDYYFEPADTDLQNHIKELTELYPQVKPIYNQLNSDGELTLSECNKLLNEIDKIGPEN